MEDMGMPPGFRFYPTEEELVSFYLHHKLEREREDLNRLMDRVIPVVDIYEFNPWDLPQFSQYLCHKDPEQWFFFIPRQESEARGGRPNRLTTTGYWKATGSPGLVYSSNNCPIGVKRTMVFYKGRAPHGRKTEWKMNEYNAIVNVEAASLNAATPTLRREFSLCRIYKKSKCLRSFDRRPLPTGREQQIQGESPVVVYHQDHQATAEVAAASHHHQPSASPQMAVAELRSMSSSESSSSVDNGNYPAISQPGETSNSSSAKVVDDFYESFWNLDGFWEFSIK